MESSYSPQEQNSLTRISGTARVLIKAGIVGIPVVVILLSIVLRSTSSQQITKADQLDANAIISTSPTLVTNQVVPAVKLTPTASNQERKLEWKEYRNSLLGFRIEYPSYWGEPIEVIKPVSLLDNPFAESGMTYSLKFSNTKAHSSYTVPHASGRSSTFKAKTMLIDDYMGESTENPVVNAMGYDSFSACNIGDNAVPFEFYINLTLPSKQIRGVRFFIPVLSDNDNDRIDMVGDKLPDNTLVCNGEIPVEQLITKLENMNLDAESRVNLNIYRHMFQSVQIF